MWLDRHRKELPMAGVDKEEDEKKMLYYTGCVPYFLFHFLSVAKKLQPARAVPGAPSPAVPASPDFDACWKEFVKFAPLRQIDEHLRKSIRAGQCTYTRSSAHT